MKIYFCLIKHHALLTSVSEGEWSALRSSSFTPGVRARCTHWIGGGVGLSASLDAVRE